VAESRRRSLGGASGREWGEAGESGGTALKVGERFEGYYSFWIGVRVGDWRRGSHCTVPGKKMSHGKRDQ
jgi:hypothetical protein